MEKSKKDDPMSLDPSSELPVTRDLYSTETLSLLILDTQIKKKTAEDRSVKDPFLVPDVLMPENNGQVIPISSDTEVGQQFIRSNCEELDK